MESVRLSLNTLEILKKRESWNLYIILVTELPDDPAQMAISIHPSYGLMKLTKHSDNLIEFVPDGNGTEGMFLLEREMPEDGSVRAGIFLMQSKKRMRNVGDLLQDLIEILPEDTTKMGAINSLGSLNPWLMTKPLNAIPISGIAKILSKLKDRELGFISLDENFGDEFKTKPSQERSGKLYSGIAELTWTWNVMG